MNIFIIHGAYGHPGENWIPWLKSDLETLSHNVIIPQFPTPEGQSLQNWLEVLSHYDLKDSVVVGHSIGVAFLLNVLEKTPVKAAFFVSGFVGSLDNPVFDDINSSFMKDFDWAAIRHNCPHFFMFHSDDDPYVPLSKAEDLARNLGTEVILVKNAGHFNEKAGYTKFELLLDTFKKSVL